MYQHIWAILSHSYQIFSTCFSHLTHCPPPFSVALKTALWLSGSALWYEYPVGAAGVLETGLLKLSNSRDKSWN